MSKQEVYYHCASLVARNALEFLESGKILAQTGLFSKSFIMTSYAVETLGQGIQYLTLASAPVELQEKMLRNHDDKNKAYELWGQWISQLPAILPLIDEGVQLLPDLMMEFDEARIVELMNTLELTETVNSDLMKKAFALPIDFGPNFELRWKDYRFKLLYVDPDDPRSSDEKWEWIKENFEEAKGIEDGSIFESIRSIIQFLQISVYYPFNVFRYITDTVLTTYKYSQE